MKIYSLPLTIADLNELELPKTAAKALDNNSLPTELIFHFMDSRQNDAALKFLSFIDETAEVGALVKKSKSMYWLLRSLRGEPKGEVFVPVEHQGKLDQTLQDAVGDTAFTILSVLRKSFDHIDVTREPFAFRRIEAREIADFSQQPASNSADEWSDAVVFYMSLGGDSLLAKGGQAAWHQLETNRIIPSGSVMSAIRRYFELTLNDVEFSSWNDKVNQ